MLPEQLHERQVPAARGGNNQVHCDNHCVIAPAIGTRFAPEARMPDEHLFLDCTKHYENQTDGSELDEDASDYPESSGALRGTEENRERLAYSNVLASRAGVFEIVPSACDKNQTNHEAQEQECEIREASQLREDHIGHSMSLISVSSSNHKYHK
jgi:hypothetical protein